MALILLNTCSLVFDSMPVSVSALSKYAVSFVACNFISLSVFSRYLNVRFVRLPLPVHSPVRVPTQHTDESLCI